MGDLAGKKAVVVGASRGLGRGVAVALAEAGAEVVAVSRTGGAAPESTGKPIEVHAADAADPAVAADLMRKHDPDLLVLVAGASPKMAPIQDQTWETFSAVWENDVQISFHWLREALLKPLKPGSRVVVVSSGAIMNGSPLSGGYAGAKAMQKYLAAYAQGEADRDGLDLTFSTVLPWITPETSLGRAAIQAYAARAGVTEAEHVAKLGPLVTPENTGAALVGLLQADKADAAGAHLLNGSGVKKL